MGSKSRCYAGLSHSLFVLKLVFGLVACNDGRNEAIRPQIETAPEFDER